MTAGRVRVRPTAVKLALAVLGLVVFGYGVRTEDRRWRWWGIAVVGVAAALRIWRERPAEGRDGSDGAGPAPGGGDR